MSDELSFNGFSIDNWLEEFEESTALTRREAKKVLYQGAKDIMAASKQMAPVDEHNLEQAHELQQVRLNEDYSEVEISVGGEVGGRNVDDYAVLMHEGLAPFGSGTAGVVQPFIGGDPKRPSKSWAKSQSNPPGREVGGKFLERAVEEYEEKIIQGVIDLL